MLRFTSVCEGMSTNVIFFEICVKGMEMQRASTEAQISKIRAGLGEKAIKWSDKGLDSLSIRSRGKGRDGELAEKVIYMYARGELDELPKEINQRAARVFNRGMLDSESVAILLLGRKSKPTSKGMEEFSASLSP